LSHILRLLSFRQVHCSLDIVPQLVDTVGAVAVTAFSHSLGMLVLVRLEANGAFRAELMIVGVLLLLHVTPPVFEHLGDLVDVLLTHEVESSLEFLHVVHQCGVTSTHQLLVADHYILGMCGVFSSSSEKEGVRGSLFESLSVSTSPRQPAKSLTTSMTSTIE
jgi:hypothetical protein